MFSGKTRIIGLLALVVLLVVGGIGAWTAGSPHVTAADSKDSRIKALLTERHATLQEVVVAVDANYKAGKLSYDQVWEANQAAHRAELDLCETDKERRAVLEKLLADAKEFEKYADQGFKNGVKTTSAALRAKVSRLEVEIELERVNAK